MTRYRFSVLFCIVVVQLLALSIELPRPWNEFVLPGINLVLAGQLFTITKRYSDGWILVVLGTAGYLLDLVIPWDTAPTAINLIKVGFWLAVPAFLGLRVFTVIYAATRVDRDHIAGALTIYLLLALVFANIYEGLLVLDPAAIRFGEHFLALDVGFGEILYSSFVTLSTLGYGDISPTAPVARASAVVEAITGIVYLAVMVAFFVSRYARRYSSLEEIPEDE